MIAYCGLDCAKCDAYIATINNDDLLKEETARIWAEMNHAPITKEMINCLGCRQDGVKTPYCDKMCKIRQCALKSNLSNCGFCGKIKNCKKVKEVLDSSNEAKQNLLGNKKTLRIIYLIGLI